VSGSSTAPERVLLVDTTKHLTSIGRAAGGKVTVQTGASMQALLTALEADGCGITAAPAPGDVSVGGVLAIDGHGAAIPASGEARATGMTYGSLSNLIRSFDAVVWDAAARQYVLRTFDRSHPHAKAFLTHLGRAFLTSVTLQVGANPSLRCVSRVDVPAAELFAAPGTAGAGRTFSRFLDEAGRVEAIWYPFTDNPWLKVWTVAPVKPLTSRAVTSPYNYPFSDQLPDDVARLADSLVSGNPQSTPAFGSAMYAATVAGLTGTGALDLWGPSKNLLLYIRPSTVRVTANGYAVLCARRDVQSVVAAFRAKYLAMVDAFAAEGAYPMAMPVEIRATGLDHTADVDAAGAEAPVLSALSPRHDHPEWDVAVWFDILTFPHMPRADEFYAAMEAWMFATYTAPLATVRPEWSKGWGYTADAGAWTDTARFETIRSEYRAGRTSADGWDWAAARLDQYDPARLYSSPLLDQLFA
jgi:FAD/FMN-containing dehydrogenase